jgi:hypothetical protein
LETAFRGEIEGLRNSLLEKENLVAYLRVRIQEMEKQMQERDTESAPLEATTMENENSCRVSVFTFLKIRNFSINFNLFLPPENS